MLAITMGRRGGVVERSGTDQVTITGASREDIGRAAVDAGVVITDMRALGDDLGAVFQSVIHQEATS